MPPLHSLMFASSVIIPFFTGITLFIVWRFDTAQKFVRDFSFSNLATVVFFMSYLSLLQTGISLRTPAFWSGVVAASLNLTFLLSSLNSVARLGLARFFIFLFWVLCLLVFSLPPTSTTVWIKIWFAMTAQVAMGLSAAVWLGKKNTSERYLGPLIALLGLSQLFVIIGGLENAALQALEASVLRFLIGFLLLASALRRSKREVRRSVERYRTMTEQSPQGVLVYAEPELLYANPAARKIYGCGDDLKSIARALLEQSDFQHYRDQLQHAGLELASWTEKKSRNDGKLLSLTFSAWRTEWNDQAAIQILINDDTDLLDSVLALRYEETHDALTGLPNRRVLLQELNKNCYGDEVQAYCLLTILNINRFKLFNQGKGHLIGDRVLCTFADKLRHVADPDTTVMRRGGDEFGLVSTNASNTAALNHRLHEVCQEPIQIDGSEFFINVAMGQAEFPLNASNADGLMRAANAAMLQAKKIPGTSLVQADTRFEESLSRALEQEQALKKAIKIREICLFYQPKVDAKTRRLVGFEALARWVKPGVGIVSPIEFIAVAEKTALISTLGAMLLNEAGHQISRWQRRYAQCVPVAVNVSPIQLLNPDFVGLVQTVLRDHQIPAHLLSLEITESAAINDLEQTQNQIRQLLFLGVRVAMDDFGTGYSSLSLLRQLPLQTLKIDRALIDPLPSADAMAIVTSICQLAEALGMEVVAEGIETEEQVAAAQRAGCHELQGYFFSRPVASEGAELWLDELNKTGSAG